MLPVKRFVDFVAQNTLFQPGTKVLVAVSGGMDSVLMAHLFKSAGYNFGIAHCNFMLRGDEANADQEFTRATGCTIRRKLPYYQLRYQNLRGG
jgi:tRNA(Ile)-lysidine synthase